MFGAEEKVTGMSMVLSKWITPITATVAAPTQSNEELFFRHESGIIHFIYHKVGTKKTVL